jgi:phage gp37-like protein
MDHDVEKELARLRHQFGELASSVASMRTELNDVAAVIQRMRAVTKKWTGGEAGASPVSQQH